MNIELSNVKNEIRDQYIKNMEYIAKCYDVGLLTSEDFFDLSNYCSYVYKHRRVDENIDKAVLDALLKVFDLAENFYTNYKTFDDSIGIIFENLNNLTEKYDYRFIFGKDPHFKVENGKNSNN